MKRIAFAATACALALSPAEAQVDLNYSPISPGSWSYRTTQLGSEASFMDSSGTQRAIVGCIRSARQVSLSRASAAPAASVEIWTSSASRALPSRVDSAVLRVTATTTAYDPLLDAVAFSRGRFALSMPGFPTLILPTGPEVDHVVEDCRAA